MAGSHLTLTVDHNPWWIKNAGILPVRASFWPPPDCCPAGAL
jgi:hypothetical protein